MLGLEKASDGSPGKKASVTTFTALTRRHYLPNLNDLMLWCCFDFTKLADGDKKGLADDSRAFLGSQPAGTIMNLRPLGDAAAVAAAGAAFGVFGLLVALKLSSLTPNFGKLGLS